MRKKDKAEAKHQALTPRELQVVELISRGWTNKQVAAELGISFETVKEHVQHILAKYNAPSREYIVIAYLKATITAEHLGNEFLEKFERQAGELERTAAELIEQVASMRSMVQLAVKRKTRKKRK